ncbi:endonuclease [Allohahella sp. A8]|uniref:endonuclease n=1 Tax=Allohahella sp. A8 TaxID=3141461 RepID=UPI000C0924E0|nr:endonuclease I [Hahellaceae bacterium]|tara:strand:- start:107458 stop:108168 length:711 start_codon:yes stop_codon:yes gene_type:complete
MDLFFSCFSRTYPLTPAQPVASSRPGLLTLLLLLSLLAGYTGVADAQTRHTDPEKTLKDLFWGDLYASGGTTLFCSQSFEKKSITIKESYIYDTAWIREQLECGTSSKCRTNVPDYRRMISDMHNIYPSTMSFELARGYSHFAAIGDDGQTGECETRKAYGVIEPQDEAKGVVARATLYMMEAYKLPAPTSIETLIDWCKRFPPDETEKARNKQIEKLQGNRNLFIDNPSRADQMR